MNLYVPGIFMSCFVRKLSDTKEKVAGMISSPFSDLPGSLHIIYGQSTISTTREKEVRSSVLDKPHHAASIIIIVL